ncbi:hypothetical protein DF142_22195 [Burkholderia cenocepacia]|nr:hypothetical protein DF142_22195 [Burkholderia cenocepacia]RQU62631.1 hypothetical protein DF140_23585 [Burkholderia cenocepacia]
MESAIASDGMTLGPDGGKVVLMTTRPLLKTWAKGADAGLKPRTDVAVIFDNEIFYMNVFADDATVKALLRGGKPDGASEGPNTLVVSVRQGEGSICPRGR